MHANGKAGTRKDPSQLHQHQPRRSSTSGISSLVASSTQKGSLDPAFLAFIAQVVAYLPFDVQEEPLFIIYHVSRLVGGLKSLGGRVGVVSEAPGSASVRSRALWESALTLCLTPHP